MNRLPADRLFAREAEFVFWLTKLMRAHSAFSQVAVEPLLGESLQRGMARADIMAVRSLGGSSETLIIECKNYPVLYGRSISDSVMQLNRYISLEKGSRPVLALPGRLSEEDAEKVRAAGVELWDLDEIRRIFRSQLLEVSPELAEALNIDAVALQTPEDILISALKACEPGRVHWPVYQKLIGRILQHLFCPPLSPPLSESPDESGVNRRDFVLANFADYGFWNYIRIRYGADYIVVDAKNYVGKVKKRDVLQIANYLKHHGAGLFGVIFSRSGGDTSARVTAREQWAHYNKLVLILDDKQCEAMLNASVSGDATSVLAKEIQDFRLAM